MLNIITERGYTALKNGRDFIETIMQTNDFISESDKLSVPTVTVIRNTSFQNDGFSYVENTGDNNCDTVLLVDSDNHALLLEGRTLPHIKYIKESVQGKGKCNYIASQYRKQAFQRGWHRGNRAAVQNVKFVVHRTKDEILRNEDDYTEHDIVADNFHGWAPFSAGCITVKGKMAPMSECWALAYNWLYHKHKRTSFFDALILEHEDLEMQTRYRLGSQGEIVQYLQSLLSNRYDIAADGIFGPYTHEVVRFFQKEHKLPVTGIIGPETFYMIEEVC
ncbi:MAG: peptidoglycan-binding protein [Spirochaetes bacterium]|nr:peptidoglycan-binding protein [Spirochaetota bacterium]MBN2771238.1 peptidoglycan-binding protein [Spirochaetota bacterium]